LVLLDCQIENTMATVTVKLPESLARRLKSTAERRGESQSALVREALRTHLERGPEPASGSCLELAQDLAGSLEGTADLSSNRRRLRGYGR
jgi:predicted transcriptional regulator